MKTTKSTIPGASIAQGVRCLRARLRGGRVRVADMRVFLSGWVGPERAEHTPRPDRWHYSATVKPFDFRSSTVIFCMADTASRKASTLFASAALANSSL